MQEVINESASVVLATIAEKAGLAPTVAASLVQTFVPLAEKAATLINDAESIVVTDATQVTEMRASRRARLDLRAVRVEIDTARKTMKEEALVRCQAIDSVAKNLRDRIEPIEARLEEQEKFAERAEAKRKAELKATRETLLAPFTTDTSFYDLASMPEATFAALLESNRLAHAARIEAAKKAEADRIAAERARQAEAERLKAENARLAREQAEEREKARQEALAAQARAEVERQKAHAERVKAKAEADRLEAEARKEREARERLEREEASRKAAAAAQARADAAAAKKAARAPDRQKIALVATTLRSVALPAVKSPEAEALLTEIRSEIEKLAAWVEKSAEEI